MTVLRQICQKSICQSVQSQISKVKTKVIIENPPTQRSLENAFNASLGTMNKIINVDLNLKKKEKTKCSQTFAKTYCRASNQLSSSV